MERPSPDPFRDAAIRTDPSDLRMPSERTHDQEPGGSPARASDRVMSDTGVAANAEPPVERRRFSLGATFLGWSVASFFTIVFVALIGALVGGATLRDGDFVNNGAIEAFAIGGLISYLVATFAAYVIGGYAAGRIALWDGVKHGALVVAWAVLMGIVALLAGAYMDTGFFIDANIPLDAADITMGGVIALVLTLAAMLAGASWGGAIGERYHERVHGAGRRGAIRSRTRGRPF